MTDDHDRRFDAVDRELNVRFDNIEQQMTRRFETARRELKEQREYFDAILSERSHARERLTETQIDAIHKTVSSGDQQLREHVADQVVQIEAAFRQAETLQVTRIAAVRTELRQAMDAADAAVGKAEVATTKRFDDANEWRQQSADRERSQQEQMTALSSTFLPREVADAQFAELRKQMSMNTDRLNVGSGARQAAQQFSASLVAWAAVFVVILSLVVGLVVRFA